MFSNLVGEERKFRNLINGQWCNSKSKEFIEIRSPINQEIVGKVPAMTREEVDEVIQIAVNAREKWKETPINERARILYKAADLLQERIVDLSDILIREIAKDRKSVESEINRTADFIRFTADTSKGIYGESIQSDNFPGFDKKKLSIVVREPVGVVLAISPFNYPINLAASKIAPALVAGNTVVLKPATQGSLCGLYLAKIFQEAGIPDGVLNTITGKGSEIGDYIVTHPAIDFINFTGSSEVGMRIAKITSMVPLLMELGGKDAAIVLGDADLDLAAKNIVDGAYSYSGQRCTAVKRVLVEECIADELVEKIKGLVEKLKVGNPNNQDVSIVPLIDEKAADFVWDIIEDARNKGAHLIVGGKREKNIIYPTLFDYVTTDMRLAWDEPFGPVLPIIRVKDKDEAIRIANQSQYGLQSSVFTNNLDNAFYVADKLEVGAVQINNKTERGPDHFPFLGVKSSGIGVQGIKYSIEAMTRIKGVILNLKK
ncbi:MULTISPECIES: NADP-dependent glyceraldehyde-3-phosphate dehydrogenase [unclassified Clostridium]|uniref:NADP-dependent glyceraldehyde-3-phosphate dehydrogenase n=1 Tax=Clostridium TaxID=1485 RepID=UPI001C8BB4D5|nr:MULTISPECIES: NADP-dependent glyceraldehyde-3-phosphate dehydrogenase [unclassified Clostridium]MBX9139289.1 NADP-dependent glyceraldehyde-3-phosphate dehydrogenase [Clostridium sp. K12(2020)]MBX9146044.1 NADP-dependent glyceraldehyde-3-phosphate dehydrogenase [Clostridium sp. K13]MDU2290949.1 NADP-dependent glyceraldehyde-3-phosphate dehydrogenase [Clostridium celatum]MDU4326234.1 NADP-dependent glyceraldehyde-3-phosphate dehydrogenase [Clostridium celatum]